MKEDSNVAVGGGVEPAGLSPIEAARRLQTDGPNELPRPRGRGFVRIVLETAREPMFLLMLGAALLYLTLGDLAEGLFLVTAALVAIGLVVVQEARSEGALAALRQLAQPRANVVRDGVQHRIPARELVVGDMLLVGEGERVPADALLVTGDVLSVDESTLSGESAPVMKRPAAAGETFASDAAPGAEISALLFAGALIVRGQAAARVARTGVRSALGRIGASLADIAHQPTPLQRSAGRLVGLLSVVALGFCAIVVLAYGFMRGDWVGGALAGITVAIALIPEEFPMVLAVFLALGAWRLATHRVLVRRSAVIESLGAANVLCVDKTGTLTENRMRVARLRAGGRTIPVESDAPSDARAERLLAIAQQACAVRPIDPMDRAIHKLVAAPFTQEPVRAWPLQPERLAVVQLRREGDDAWRAAAKGAPEAIFALCDLAPAEISALQDELASFAKAGLRVLGVASARGRGAGFDQPEDVAFSFEGLVGFLDPLRADVPHALNEARGAGVAVVMITGDHPATALAIAAAAGIDVSDGALTGAEIAALPFPTLRERLHNVRVFARVAPEQKLLLVEAYKAEGAVVAMTGDGVNDAPALEAADIGIAMGRRGADVAREAADLVLLDDSFASIVGGIRLGRRIFTNLRNALTYITAIHVPIAGLALIPILLGLPPILLPMHVVLLELAVDPICALVFEAERSEADAMRKPPRSRDEMLFGVRQIAIALAQGCVLLAGVFGLYVWSLDGGEAQARGAAFIALAFGNLALALADSLVSGRLFARQRLVYWIIAAAVAGVVCAAFVVPVLAAAFAIAAPAPTLLALALAVAAAAGIVAGLLKRAATRSGRAQVLLERARHEA
jgi:Ca2+-transporting ATPase